MEQFCLCPPLSSSHTQLDGLEGSTQSRYTHIVCCDSRCLHCCSTAAVPQGLRACFRFPTERTTCIAAPIPDAAALASKFVHASSHLLDLHALLVLRGHPNPDCSSNLLSGQERISLQPAGDHASVLRGSLGSLLMERISTSPCRGLHWRWCSRETPNC